MTNVNKSTQAIDEEICFCPLCASPMYRTIYDEMPKSGEKQRIINICSACGPYEARCDIGNIPNLVKQYESGHLKNYRKLPRYRNFLTHLRRSMAKQRMDYFLKNPETANWFNSPAIIHNVMLEKSLVPHIYINLAEQVDNANILFAEYEQNHIPIILEPVRPHEFRAERHYLVGPEKQFNGLKYIEKSMKVL